MAESFGDLDKRDPQLATTVKQRFDDVYTALSSYKQGDTYVPYTDLTETDTRKLAQAVDAPSPSRYRRWR